MHQKIKRNWRKLWQRNQKRNQNQQPKINQDTRQAVDVLTIMYIIVILPTWIWIDNPTSHWLVNDISYVFRSVFFPFLLYLFYREKVFKLLTIVALLGIFSTFNDYELIDVWDDVFLFPKIVLTLYAIMLMVKKLFT